MLNDCFLIISKNFPVDFLRISCETNFLGYSLDSFLSLLHFVIFFIVFFLSILRGAIERAYNWTTSSRLCSVRSYCCSLCCWCCLDDDCEAHENIPCWMKLLKLLENARNGCKLLQYKAIDLFAINCYFVRKWNDGALSDWLDFFVWLSIVECFTLKPFIFAHFRWNLTSKWTIIFTYFSAIKLRKNL